MRLEMSFTDEKTSFKRGGAELVTVAFSVYCEPQIESGRFPVVAHLVKSKSSSSPKTRRQIFQIGHSSFLSATAQRDARETTMLFPSSSTQTQVPAPSRSARESCWEHRDIYFACLDKSNVAIPGEELKAGQGRKEAGEDHCRKEREVYGKECAASWVRYRFFLGGGTAGGMGSVGRVVGEKRETGEALERITDREFSLAHPSSNDSLHPSPRPVVLSHLTRPHPTHSDLSPVILQKRIIFSKSVADDCV